MSEGLVLVVGEFVMCVLSVLVSVLWFLCC